MQTVSQVRERICTHDKGQKHQYIQKAMALHGDEQEQYVHHAPNGFRILRHAGLRDRYEVLGCSTTKSVRLILRLMEGSTAKLSAQRARRISVIQYVVTLDKLARLVLMRSTTFPLPSYPITPDNVIHIAVITVLTAVLWHYNHDLVAAYLVCEEILRRGKPKQQSSMKSTRCTIRRATVADFPRRRCTIL